MKPSSLPILVLSLALFASACSGKGAADPSGQAIKAATSYTLQRVPLGKRWTPRQWSGEGLRGGSLSGQATIGAVSVINFWASWCGPCRAEQAELEKLWKEYEPKGARFVGVNIRDSRVNALAHVDEFGVTYPSVFNKDSTIAYGFHVVFIPTTYVLDDKGQVAARIIGVTHDHDLRAVLDEELAR